MSKDTHPIMVVEKDVLFKNAYFSGFSASGGYESVILANMNYMARERAENDPRYKQPIAYSIIVNRRHKRVFAYQRASRETQYDEARLMGKWSWGVGGHIEQHDSHGGNPIHESMVRELREEVSFNGSLIPKVLGYINDDSTDVGRVHFGILYIAETDALRAAPLSAELARGSFRTIEELEAILENPDCSVEEWSHIALPPLKSYLHDILLQS